MHDISFTYHKESVILTYHNQYIAYHSYGQKNKRRLARFKQAIETTPPQDLNEVFYFARLHGVPSMSVSESACKIIY